MSTIHPPLTYDEIIWPLGQDEFTTWGLRRILRPIPEAESAPVPSGSIAALEVFTLEMGVRRSACDPGP